MLKISKGSLTSHRPTNIVPATVLLRQPHLLILNCTGSLTNNPTIDLTTLQDHITALPLTDQWASIIAEISDDGIDLAHGIHLGTATAISDGSYHNNYGTSCSILHGSN